MLSRQTQGFATKIVPMKIKPALRVSGSLVLPGDKSISHRAAMFAAMADGVSAIDNFAASADCSSTLECLQKLGIKVDRDGSHVEITGGPFSAPAEPLDCGNSGTTMRLMAGILAGRQIRSTLIGDASLSSRPMKRVIEPLTAMGAVITSNDGRAPLEIAGGRPLTGMRHTLSIASAQIKSCILLAGLNAHGRTTVVEPVQTRDHTERMLRWFGVDVDTSVPGEISVDGGQQLAGRSFSVPGDISSAAFFLVAAACLNGSELTITNVGLNPSRTGILDVLQRFGVDLSIHGERTECGEPVGDITVHGSGGTAAASNLLNGSLIANAIDEIPILAILGTYLDGGIEIRDAAELRVKESDRIAAVVDGLKRMGAEVEEFPDGFLVSRSRLKGAVIESYGDHRIAMAFAVAGLLAEGETEILGADCVDVSFPGFFETLDSVVSS